VYLPPELIMFYSGLYLPVPEPDTNPEPIKRAVIAAVLHSTKSLRTTARFANYIMDQSHRGHNALVNDIHAKLIEEGEKCHKVSCTERGDKHDVHYTLGDVHRDHVSGFVCSLPVC
jgi:hypothetical protein